MSCGPESPRLAAAVASQFVTLTSASLGSRRGGKEARTGQQPGGEAAPAEPLAAAAAAPAPASPRRSPDGLDMACLNGVRALSCLAVPVYHSWRVWSLLESYESVVVPLTERSWMLKLVSTAGNYSVDVFLVLTAMLAAHHLIPLLERPDTTDGATTTTTGAANTGGGGSSLRRVAGYWSRRARRILPAYLLTNLLMLAVGLVPKEGLPPDVRVVRNFMFGSCPRGVLSHLLFISNFRLVAPGRVLPEDCGRQLWSLAVQAQFYLAFPLLLCALRPRARGFRARVAAALAAAAAASVAWRCWAVAVAPPSLHLPFGDLALPEEAAAFASVTYATYFPTQARTAELALGALLGLALRTPGALRWLGTRRVLVGAVALALQAACTYLALGWSAWGGLPGTQAWHPATTRVFLALFQWGSPFVAAAICATLLALMLRSDPVHAAMTAALGSAPLKHLADLSYSIYLLHELARYWIVLYVLPPGLLPALTAAAPLAAFVFQAGFTLAGAYLGALLMYGLVERRF